MINFAARAGAVQTVSRDGDPPKSPLVWGNRKLHVEGNLIPLGRTGYTSAAEWVIRGSSASRHASGIWCKSARWSASLCCVISALCIRNSLL